MRGERRHSRVFPCQRWELGWVQARGSRGGREGCLESTIMPRLQWAKLGRRPRRLTNAQSSPVNGFHSTHPLVLSLSLSLSRSLSLPLSLSNPPTLLHICSLTPSRPLLSTCSFPLLTCPQLKACWLNPVVALPKYTHSAKFEVN